MKIPPITGLNVSSIATLGVLGLGVYLIYKYTSSAGKLSTLGDGLTHPIESLSALFYSSEGLEKKYASPNGAQLTQSFSDYIDRNGGTEAYIAAHQNGTWQGTAFTNPNYAPYIKPVNPVVKSGAVAPTTDFHLIDYLPSWLSGK